jgi:acylglycerol lipase
LAIRFEPDLPAALVALLWPISMLMPELGLKKLDSSFLSHDAEIVRSYENDPLVFRGKLKARLAVELTWNIHKLKSRAPLLQTPLLLLHGEADRIAGPQGSRLIFNRAGSADKTLRLYPGLYHEILNEPENIQVMADIRSWLEKHL